MASLQKAAILEGLQRDILRLQGFKQPSGIITDVGLGMIMDAFPEKSFPIGAVHEFVSEGTESQAATSGFLTGLLSTLMGSSGTLLWISTSRTLFPPAVRAFGVQPDRCIFIDVINHKDVLWVMEEALKCDAITAVVGEVKDMDFTISRRLQLAVEASKVTGFLLRNNVRRLDTTACVSRWKITSMPGEPIDQLPGVGRPKWKVELLRVRNGKPGAWIVQWKNGQFLVAQSISRLEDDKVRLIHEGMVKAWQPSDSVKPGDYNEQEAVRWEEERYREYRSYLTANSGTKRKAG